MSIKTNCHHCNKEIKPKQNGSIVLNGFFDMDTKYNVGLCCKLKHYQLKSKTEFKNLFSEFPITIIS